MCWGYQGPLAVALPPTVPAEDGHLPALDSPWMLLPLSLNDAVSLREAFGRIAGMGRAGGQGMVLWLRHGGLSLRNGEP